MRNTALGICSAYSRVGSIAASLLPALLGSHGALLLIAVVCAVAATLSWTAVPETVGRGLSDRLPIMDRAASCAACCGRRTAKKLLEPGAGDGVEVQQQQAAV